MITQAQLITIGQFGKPHGVNGEIVATVDDGIDLSSLKCIVVNIDGINIPFFIKGIRPKSSDSILLQLDGIDSDERVRPFSGNPIYALKDDVPTVHGNPDEDGLYAADLVGYAITEQGTAIGKIVDIEDSTANALFVVEKGDGNIVYIPIADEMIVDIDTEHKVLSVSLPDGLLNL